MSRYGKIAYEAYVNYSKGKSLVSGAPLPSWEDQAPEIQKAWSASAKAVGQAISGSSKRVIEAEL